MAKQSNRITAEQILASLSNPSSPASSSETLGDIIVGYAADSIDTSITFASRLIGASQAAGKNFDAHRKLELGVQQFRSQQRLQRAAERAAAILNA